MLVVAGVVENVGWTNGSMHNVMGHDGPSWAAQHMLDVALVATLAALVLVALFLLGIKLMVRRLRRAFARPHRRLEKKSA